MVLSIRRAEPSDAEVLSKLAQKIFVDTFAEQNTADDIALHVARSYSKEIQLAEINDPSRTYLLAEVGGKSVGFAMLGVPRSQACHAFDAPIELFRFYIDKDWHGKGVAGPLMNACEAEARARGGRTICLSVWEHNPRAIRFYEKIGYRKSGTHPYLLGNDVQTDWVMTRAIPG